VPDPEGHERVLTVGQQRGHRVGDVGGQSRGLLAIDAFRDLAHGLQADPGGGAGEVQTLPEAPDLQAQGEVAGIGDDERAECRRGGDLGVAGAAEPAVVVLLPGDGQQNTRRCG
jgi:hypothetical protein